MKTIRPIYTYSAFITDVYDGDTVTANVDLGMNSWKHDEKLRLNGIDAPELRGDTKKEGRYTRDYLSYRILDKWVVIESHGLGKYGRWVCDIWIEGVNINKELVEMGLAVYREY